MAFEKVAALQQLPDGLPVQVKVGAHPVALVRLGDEVKAIYDVCSHQEYPLHEGIVWGRSLECALHGSTFDLETGEAESLPATTPVPVFATRTEGDDVYIDIERQLNDAPIPEH